MISWRILVTSSLMAGFALPSFALPIFSKIENPWPSSSATRESLLQDIRQIIEVPWAQTYLFPEKLGWIPESDLWNVNDLSISVYLRPQAELKTAPSMSVKTVHLEILNQPWKIVARNHHWFQISAKDQKEKPWVRSYHLMSDAFAWDNFVVLDTTDLKQSPQQTAKAVCSVAKDTLVRHIGFSGHYAKVNACGGMGYIHLSHLLGKIYFARKIKLKDSTWHTISRVNVNEVIDTDYRPINFSEILAFEFDPKIRYSKTNSIVLHKVPRKSSFLGTFGFSTPQKMPVLQTRSQRWAQSYLKGIGAFWWDFSAGDYDHDLTAKSLPSTAVLSGKIFDFASNPTNPNQKIASAQGIFQTRDNKNWNKVEQFGDQNFPVAISASGKIFVGPFVSEDNGQNYRPFVRWDRLLRSINRTGLFSLSQLRIGEIQALGREGNKIRFTLYIGDHSIQAETSDLGRSWKVLR